eukprot:scaffold3340_cov255-Pinguiococcus_pyrenoidosus.AAC.19
MSGGVCFDHGTNLQAMPSHLITQFLARHPRQPLARVVAGFLLHEEGRLAQGIVQGHARLNVAVRAAPGRWLHGQGAERL